MLATKTEMKEQATKLLKSLDIYEPYIEAFNSDREEVCMFERYGGYYISQYSDLLEKTKKLEEKYKFLVYAITHEHTEFGECYSFLYVPQNKAEWEKIPEEDGIFFPYVYVWNKDEDLFSEFGEIGVRCFGGGITRIY